MLAAIGGNAAADGRMGVRQGPADHQLIKTGPGGGDAMDDFITMRRSMKRPPAPGLKSWGSALFGDCQRPRRDIRFCVKEVP